MSLDLLRKADHHPGQAIALNNVGWAHALLGDYGQTLAFCQEALDLHRRLGTSRGAASAWDSLGYTHHHLGDHVNAIACYERALELSRVAHDRYNDADTLIRLGEVHRAWATASGRGPPGAGPSPCSPTLPTPTRNWCAPGSTAIWPDNPNARCLTPIVREFVNHLCAR